MDIIGYIADCLIAILLAEKKRFIWHSLILFPRPSGPGELEEHEVNEENLFEKYDSQILYYSEVFVVKWRSDIDLKNYTSLPALMC